MNFLYEKRCLELFSPARVNYSKNVQELVFSRTKILPSPVETFCWKLKLVQ